MIARSIAALNVVGDLDIWRSANLLVKQHGDDAWFHASQEADARLEAGDVAGQRVWLRIRKAIEDLQREQPHSGEPMH